MGGWRVCFFLLSLPDESSSGWGTVATLPSLSAKYEGAASPSLLRLGISLATFVSCRVPRASYVSLGGGDRPRGDRVATAPAAFETPCRLLHRVLLVGCRVLLVLDVGLLDFVFFICLSRFPFTFSFHFPFIISHFFV